MKKPLDFSLVANNDKLVTLTALKKDGTPMPLTGVSIKWSFFKKGSSTPYGVKKTSDGSIVVIDADGGKFRFRVLAADTEDMDAGEYIHEAVTVDADGHPVTITNDDPQISAGIMTIRKQYTVQD